MVPSEPSTEVEVEVVPPCQTEYPPVLKAVGSADEPKSHLFLVHFSVLFSVIFE